MDWLFGEYRSREREERLKYKAAAERYRKDLDAVLEGGLFLKELADLELAPEDVKYRLGKVEDDDPVYEAVMKVIQRQSEVEIGMTLGPGKTNEERQYACGRCAAVADILFMVEGIRAEGRRMAEEREREP